jgi:hypothetical protein
MESACNGYPLISQTGLQECVFAAVLAISEAIRRVRKNPLLKKICFASELVTL